MEVFKRVGNDCLEQHKQKFETKPSLFTCGVRLSKLERNNNMIILYINRGYALPMHHRSTAVFFSET